MITYIFVVLMLFLIPGPAVIVTISQTIKGGKKNGIVTSLGIACGDLVHTIAAILGLSAILMTSAFAFEAVKYVGAAYLLYLGVRSFLERSKKAEKHASEKGSANLSFRNAFLIELLNPKTALFFLAFLPQFIQKDGSPVTIQLLTLGMTFVLMSIIYTTLLAVLTSIVGERLLSKMNQSSQWIGKAVGLIYIGLGIRLALQSQN